MYYGAPKNGIYIYIRIKQSQHAILVHLSYRALDSEMDGDDGGIQFTDTIYWWWYTIYNLLVVYKLLYNIVAKTSINLIWGINHILMTF